MDFDIVKELKENANGLHDGMGGHADECAEIMQVAAVMIARLQAELDTERASLFAESQRKQQLQENYAAQGLALKAAKAMQQAETERADSNDKDAERYRWLRKKAYVGECYTERGKVYEIAGMDIEVKFVDVRCGDDGDEVDAAIDAAIAANHATIQAP